MRVKMKVEVSGSRDGAAWPPLGEILDVPDAEGADMIRAGQAEAVGDKPVEVRPADEAKVEKRPAKSAKA